MESLEPATAKKMVDFISGGGRIFCIETYPTKSLGWKDFKKKDQEVVDLVVKMKKFPDRFIFLSKPDDNFIGWYQEVQVKYNLSPYVKIRTPKPFISQVRYQTPEAEIFLFTNSSDSHTYFLEAIFLKQIGNRKQMWLWDAVTGNRFRLKLNDGKLNIDIGPADSKIIIFDKEKDGKEWEPKPTSGAESKAINSRWDLTFEHTNGTVLNATMDKLKDLKDTLDYVNFSGTVTYKNSFDLKNGEEIKYLNLGKVYGISKVKINGKEAGIEWYGSRIFPVAGLLNSGVNTIEIMVITVMGNYMKTLKDNVVAQYWTNEKRKDQPLQSMGLVGPVTIY